MKLCFLKMSFYGIFVPSPNNTGIANESLVFTKIDDALRVLKREKNARLKNFTNRADAVNFTRTGFFYQPEFDGLKSPSPAIEKNPFRTLTKQELIAFRKLIEENNYSEVKKLIWENPRYLINSGDTPTSLKDGPRYNAMHVCAIHNLAEIAKFILQTLNTMSFIELIHGKKTPEACQEVSDILLDYFLNLPEKGRRETPLHLAAKYGSLEVVEVLIFYPQCKMLLNSENRLPQHMICARVDRNRFDFETGNRIKMRMTELLNYRFYVPVIRSVDNSVPPFIGEPFTPSEPPQLNNDPVSPEMVIRACAGPMSEIQAITFRQRWKTPPRKHSEISSYIKSIKVTPSSPNNSSKKSNTSTLSLQNLSIKKSLEYSSDDSENRNDIDDKTVEEKSDFKKLHLAASTPLLKDVNNRELFFSYRDCTASSPVILNDTDNMFLNNSDVCESPGWKERHIKLSDTEKGLELIGREIARSRNCDWREYWDFLECFINIASPEGLQKLESYLKERTQINDNGNYKNASPKTNDSFVLTNLCHALDGLKLDKNKLQQVERISSYKIKEPLPENSQNITPYLCMEKSLQVFAKRMTKTILNNLSRVLSINDTLTSELKRLKSLICSFKEDARFQTVDFSVVHSRFAKLIVEFLMQSTEVNDAILQSIRLNFSQIMTSQRNNIDNLLLHLSQPKSGSKSQLHCVSEFILANIDKNGWNTVPENFKTEENCENTWKMEEMCDCAWESGNCKSSNKKKRMAKKSISTELLKPDGNSKNSSDIPNSPLLPDSEYHSEEIDINSFLDAEDGEDEVFWQATDVTVNREQQLKDVGNNNYNPKDNNQFSSNTNTDLDDDDDDVFWSIKGSDDDDDDSTLPAEIVKTPTYNIFILGNELSKRDLDVMHALGQQYINSSRYPHVYRWKSEVMKLLNQDHDRVLSPTTIVTSKKNVEANKDANFVPKRLFESPFLPPSENDSSLTEIEDGVYDVVDGFIL